MSLRDNLRTAGRVGYQILDNIIGFDDDYDTVGELLARSLREDPRGTAGSIASGVYEGARSAVTQPVQTARDIANEFADAYFRLREGLPEDATRDDIGQLTEDLTLFGSLVPAVGATARTARAVTRAAPEAELDRIFGQGAAQIEPPEDWLDDIQYVTADEQLAALAEQRLEQQLARREALISAFGGEEQYQNALRGWLDMDPMDNIEAAQNLGEFTVLERTLYDLEDGPMPVSYSVAELAGMSPDAVRALITQTNNDPSGIVYNPELAEMLADMTQAELADITGLPIQTYAGAWDPNALPNPPGEINLGGTPFDPDDIDFGPDIDQIAAGADPFGGGPDPFDDPFQGIPGTRTLPDTAPATAIPAVNPYTPTNAAVQFPQTWTDQGVAGIYSRSGRAASQLRQPRYSDIESLRKELEARGASPSELNYQIGALEEDFAAGPVPREVIQEVFMSPEYNTGLMIDRTLKYAGGWMPSGGRNATSTVYYHPEGRFYPPGAKRHFPDIEDDTGQAVVPLFHSRAAQYDLGFPGGGTTHHVAEIQSDFSQYRQTIPREGGRWTASENRDAFDQAYDAPYIRRENDWVDAAIRQNLIDAVNSGSDWITFGNGKQANTHIGMPLEAAKSFYDTRVPRRIEDVLRRFANQSGINAPQLERVPFVDGDDVLGFRITPEFREALIKNGLPSYKNGGIVSLLRN